MSIPQYQSNIGTRFLVSSLGFAGGACLLFNSFLASSALAAGAFPLYLLIKALGAAAIIKSTPELSSTIFDFTEKVRGEKLGYAIKDGEFIEL